MSKVSIAFKANTIEIHLFVFTTMNLNYNSPLKFIWCDDFSTSAL